MTTPVSPNEALPLHELNIVPEWIKSTPKSYEQHTGEDAAASRRDRNRRPPRSRRPEAESATESQPARREDRRPQPHGVPTRQQQPQERRPSTQRAPLPVAPLEVSFLPEEKGLAAMIETMKHSPRAYALFDLAKLILNKPERHLVKLALKPGADGTRPPLFLVLADESVFQTQSDALHHLFRHHSDKLCRQEKKPCDPPKGNFTCINRCGITGEVFGPPNYHEYQSLLVRHHQRRLRHMPFEEFKARIQSSKDPDAIAKWIESKSFIYEYHCLLCAEPKILTSRDELEKHITETHLAQLITSAPELQISGAASRSQPRASIAEALRLAWIAERKFPLRTAQTLSDRLRPEGFHFFKHRKGITYVSSVRPKRFESLDGLSDQVQKIITFLRAHPDSVRKQLAENLQPTDEERLLADLHWLIQEGYVVEFADGRLWALENRPPTPPAPPAPPATEPPATIETASAPESSASTATAPAAAEPVSPPEPAPAAVTDAPPQQPSSPSDATTS